MLGGESERACKAISLCRNTRFGFDAYEKAGLRVIDNKLNHKFIVQQSKRRFIRALAHTIFISIFHALNSLC